LEIFALQNQWKSKNKGSIVRLNTGTPIVLVSIFCLLLTWPVSGMSQTGTGCLPPPPGLVSWWPGDGNALDIIGENDGTLMNGTTFASGMIDQAFSFDGVDDMVGFSATNINDLQKLTIDAWVKHNALPPGQIMRYVSVEGEKAFLRYDGENGPGQLHFYMIIDGVQYNIRVNNVLQVGVFHHIAGTYDGSAMRLYFGGVEVGSLDVSGAVGYADVVTLGGSEEPFDGLLDEVDIYNRALSVSEIQSIFNAGSDGKCKSDPVPSPDVFEDFSSEPVPFSDEPFFSVSNGRFFFHGDRSDGASGVVWVGGSNPGGETPRPENSNYFDNFKISVDTNWEGGADNYAYGLAVCTQKNSSGTTDHIYFGINKKGGYLIGKVQNGEYETIVDWQKSSLIATSGQNNNLSIKKVGPYFHFYINEVEVARRIIVGYHGGGIGVWGNHQVDASFDNFAVTRLSADYLEADSNDVFENFNTGSGGFSECTYFSALTSRYVFRGNRSDYTHFHAWIGGFDPGGWDAQPDNSNYFENFAVSVDTYWEGGAEDYVYGLTACIQENSLGTADSVRFNITGDGWYIIAKYEDGVFGKLVDWTPSDLILTWGQKNNLSIQKDGNQFHFYINNTKVQQLTISGFSGGSVGVEASQHVDVSFDNFSLTIPGAPPTANAGADRKINEGNEVTLNGSNSSDPDDGIYSYQWYQITGPPVALSDSTINQPIFTAPYIVPNSVDLTFQLTVTDHSRLRSTDICVVTVNNRPATPWILLLLLDGQ
jgi:hypothetical protein